MRITKQGNESEYKPVRANAYIGTDGEVKIVETSQQDRIEYKLDKIINLLEE